MGNNVSETGSEDTEKSGGERCTYIPLCGAVKGFGYIVHALTVPSDEENLVLHVRWGVFIQVTYVIFETLPLLLLVLRIILLVG